jgi:hypothetical protein
MGRMSGYCTPHRLYRLVHTCGGAGVIDARAQCLCEHAETTSVQKSWLRWSCRSSAARTVCWRTHTHEQDIIASIYDMSNDLCGCFS